MKKKVTIVDIAKHLGVSITTVSLILNDKAKENRISDALTRRVLDYVKRVGYKPNRLARGNRMGLAKTFGVVVDDISNAFFSSLIAEIEGYAYDKGYHVFCCSVKGDDDRGVELLRLFQHKEIDGLIVAPTDEMADTIEYLLKKQVPIVFVDRQLDAVKANAVVSDNKLGAYLGVQSLFVDKGALKVGFVGTNSNQQHMKARLNGYMKAVDEAGGDFSIKKVKSSLDMGSIMQEIRSFIEDNKLDGIIFACNELALLGLKVIKEANLAIQHMVSFDDNMLFSVLEPPVTAIVQDTKEMAKQVVSLLVDEVNGKNRAGLKQLVLPCELLKR